MFFLCCFSVIAEASLVVNRRRIARVFLYRRSRGRSGEQELRRCKVRKLNDRRTLGLLVELPEVLPLLLVDDSEDSGNGLADSVAT